MLGLRSLHYVRINFRDSLVRQSGHTVQHHGRIWVERIVELHDGIRTSPIGQKRHLTGIWELLQKRGIQQFPVRAAPPVDTLLHVPDNQVSIAFRDTVGKQRTEIVPLYPGSVLEFVYKEMVEPDTEFLVDERRVASVDYPFENSVGVVNAQHIFLSHKTCK